ncbi:MAG: hypothetical protein SGPRY_014317 [Prymnesium sp.]
MKCLNTPLSTTPHTCPFTLSALPPTPQEFLHIVNNCPLLPEPELLSDFDESDAMITQRDEHSDVLEASLVCIPLSEFSGKNLGAQRSHELRGRSAQDVRKWEGVSRFTFSEMPDSMSTNTELRETTKLGFAAPKTGASLQASRSLEVSLSLSLSISFHCSILFPAFDLSDLNHIVPSIMQLKWDVFGKYEFRREFLIFCLELISTSSFFFYVLRTSDLSMQQIGSSHPLLLLLLAFNVMAPLFKVYRETKEMQFLGLVEYLQSPWNSLDILMILGQVSVPFCFIAGPYCTPSARLPAQLYLPQCLHAVATNATISYAHHLKRDCRTWMVRLFTYEDVTLTSLVGGRILGLSIPALVMDDHK